MSIYSDNDLAQGVPEPGIQTTRSYAPRIINQLKVPKLDLKRVNDISSLIG
jgi:hypothetical protein